MQFEWSDGWLLMSVLWCGDDGADLSTIIGVGDMLNHAIFNLEELRDGFRRLLAAGLVAEENGQFQATVSAREMYQKIRRRRLGMFTQVEAMAQMLRSIPPVLQTQEQEYSLSQEVYEESVKSYLKLWSKN